jgi:importin-7
LKDLQKLSSGASTLLQAILKRQGIMQHVLEFILQNLSSSTSNIKQIDGALHMISVVLNQLNNSKKYKKDVEKLLDTHVTPRIVHEVFIFSNILCGSSYVFKLFFKSCFIRLRACYVIHFASDTSFKALNILERIINALIKSLKEDNEIPVKVEAALALQSLINDQDQKGKGFFHLFNFK